jgi:cell division protein FtsB
MSRRSDTSSLVKRKRAKAEALRASVAFAERQAALLKQEAQMEATAARRKAMRIYHSVHLILFS